MSLIKILLEFDAKKFDRLARFFRDNRFAITGDERINKYYVGSGVAGSVYTSPKYPDMVVRVGHVMQEDGFEAVKGKKFDNVVEVKYHKQIPDRNSYITVMEKLEGWDDDLYDTMNSLKIRYEDNVVHEFLKSHEFYEMAEDDWDGVRKAYNMVVSVDPKGYDVADWNDVKKHIEDVANGIKELKSVGIRHQDLHGGNIMYDPKTDNYKIIDLA